VHMILFNRDLLFVHNPKTAGTSLLAWFSLVLEAVEKVGVKELGTHHPSLSLALGYACARTGNRPEDFKRVISVVREPVERERSMYDYFRFLAKTPGTVEELNDDAMWRVVQRSAELDCNLYMQWLEKEFGTCDIWRSRCYYRTAEGHAPGNLRVVRFHNLQEELASALDGVSMADRTVPLPHLNRSESNKVVFDDNSIDFIRRSYAWQGADGLL